MALEHLPQQREQSLVRQDRLPARFDEPRTAPRDMLSEVIGHQPFPRVQLEQVIDRIFLQVGKTAVGIDADILDIDQPGFQSALARAVGHVFDRAFVLFRVLAAGEVQRAVDPHIGPRGGQRLVQRIELVASVRNQAAFDRLFQPDPLEHAGLYSDVGVSALYSNSLAGPEPSYAKSMRP